MASLTYREAAHVLRRLAFSGPPQSIQALVGTKREKAIDALVNYSKNDNSHLDGVLLTDFPFLSAKVDSALNDTNFNETEIRQWWFERMLVTSRPLEEKMTLFWHNFFATSVDKVPVVHMYNQNVLLRKFALARYDDLLLAVAKDPAMLIWLDGVINKRGEQNENFGRELQELFSMGPFDVSTNEPNYTEDDVKEIARAFTGWRFRRTADKSPFSYEWFLDPNDADTGSKTIYGQTAAFTGEDVIALICARRATARFLVKRLFEFFVYPLDPSTDADRATIEKFADVYLANDHSIKALVRAIFVSDEFFSARAIFGLVKTPPDHVFGTMNAMGATFVFGLPQFRDQSLEKTMRNMGMDLFRPPNVFGWKLNRGFLTNDGMLERYNFADYMAGAFSFTGVRFGLRLLSPINNVKKTVERSLAATLAPFAQLELSPDVTSRLQTYMLTNPQGNIGQWDRNNRGGDFYKIENVIRLVLCLPESQLN